MEPLGESRREEKPGGEWVSSSSTEKKTSVYSPWPLCHPWILFTPREVLTPIEAPRHGPPSLPRALATFIGTLHVLCDLPHPFIPPLFLRAKSREMLREHCKLITAANIYYMTAGGLHGRDASVRKWLITNIIHFVSQVNFHQLISHPRNKFRFLFHTDKKELQLNLTDFTFWVLHSDKWHIKWAGQWIIKAVNIPLTQIALS